MTDTGASGADRADEHPDGKLEAEVDSLARVSTGAFLHVEHGAYVAVGVLLTVTVLVALFGAAAVLIRGLPQWAETGTLITVIDRMLFVLMLIEILHTVRVSLRSGRLTGEPFLIVGLIASIRRVLVITLETSNDMHSTDWTPEREAMFRSSMIELAVLGGLIVIMVVSIYILQRARPHQGSAGLMEGQ